MPLPTLPTRPDRPRTLLLGTALGAGLTAVMPVALSAMLLATPLATLSATPTPAAATTPTAPAATVVPATYPATPDYLAAFQTFQRAYRGERDAIEPAAEQFVALSQARPGDPLTLAYAGSATTLRATTTWLPWRTMSHAEDGLAMLDRALALLGPAHDQQQIRGSALSLEVRFTAARTFLALPDEMFHRAARGQRLLDEVLASPLLATAALPLRGEIWLQAGQRAAEQKQTAAAQRWLRLAIDQQTPQAARASALLQELGR